MNLPTEITGAFTDLGYPYYEWTVNGHNWCTSHGHLNWDLYFIEQL